MITIGFKYALNYLSILVLNYLSILANDWYKTDVFNVPSLPFTKNSVPPTREKDKGNNRVWFSDGVNEISR